MIAYIIVMLVLGVFSALIHIVGLARGTVDRPLSPAGRAVVVIVQMCFVMWAAYLLLTHASGVCP